MITELTSYQRWQLEKYGNILPSTSELFTHEEIAEREQQTINERLSSHFESNTEETEPFTPSHK